MIIGSRFASSLFVYVMKWIQNIFFFAVYEDSNAQYLVYNSI